MIFHRFQAGRFISAARSFAAGRLFAAGIGLCAATCAWAQPPPTVAPHLPATVAELLEAPPAPRVLPDPTGRYLLLVHERHLLPRHRLNEPVVTVAGVKINPVTWSRHAALEYYALSLVDVATGAETALDVPADATLGHPLWSGDGNRFAFTATVADGVELWVGDPRTASVERRSGPDLNATLSAPCTFMPDNRRLLCRLIDGEKTPFSGDPSAGDPLYAPIALGGSSASMPLEPQQVRRWLEARLTIIDATTAAQRPVGGPAAVESVEVSPSGHYLLVSRIVPPYPQLSGVDEVHRAVEIWDRDGHVIRTLPPADSAPHAPRAVGWHAALPATLVWVERHDGGDRLLAQSAPFSGSPREVLRLEHGYAGREWLNEHFDLLVFEFDAERRTRRDWLVAWDGTRARLLGEHDVDAAGDSAFGRPLRTLNRYGRRVAAVHEGGLYVEGRDYSTGAAVTRIDRIDLATLEPQRIYSAPPGVDDAVMALLSARDGTVLTRRRLGNDEPPNYFIAGRGEARALTHFEHPAPQLRDARRMPLRYERADGVRLAANLYLPASHPSGEPLPLIVWAYPRTYGPDVREIGLPSADRFPDFDRAFKLFFVLEGYAVLDDVAMPVIGEAPSANDTFIEQVVTNAYAAVEAAAATGLIDRRRIAIAGHSYGAFMVANLLVHSDLFAAGAALSGAYNRTLTPFGFQMERRSLWEAPETYLEMSPFLYSDRIREPLLLVHGLLDQNAGTSPLQSMQLYEAIRHHGGAAELLLLPREGHVYRSRDGVLATAGAMLDFFAKHLRASDTAVEHGPGMSASVGSGPGPAAETSELVTSPDGAPLEQR